MNLEAAVHEVDDPVLGDAVFGVKRALDVPVVGQRGVGHLQHEVNVRRPRLTGGVEVVPTYQQGEVRLGLAVGQTDRVLNTPRGRFAHQVKEEFDNSIEARGVKVSDG